MTREKYVRRYMYNAEFKRNLITNKYKCQLSNPHVIYIENERIMKTPNVSNSAADHKYLKRHLFKKYE
jgi:hypothetical protein